MNTPEPNPVHEPEEKTARSKALKDCEPLLTTATRDLYGKNGFRITGLQITATAKEVSKHGERLKVIKELGQTVEAIGAFDKNPPATGDEIREALQRLKDPENRLIDEFFWFWPQELSQTKRETAMDALSRGNRQQAIELWKTQEAEPENQMVARHNLAIAYHVAAMDLENQLIPGTANEKQKKDLDEAWQQAFARWESVVTDEGVWERVAQRIRQLDDQRLTTGFGRRMRGSLPEALDKVNAELALAYAEAGKPMEALRHVKYMRQSNQGLDNVEKTSERVLAPTRARIMEQMTRATERGEADPKGGVAAAKELLDQGRKVLLLFDLFFGKRHSTRSELSDDIARICNQLPVAYHKATGDDGGCIEVLTAALRFATSAELREQIEKNIETLTGNLQGKRLAPVYATLKTVQESTETAKRRLERMRTEVHPLVTGNLPNLPTFKEQKNELCDAFAVVLRAISLDAWNKDHDKVTAVSANNWALEYATEGELLARLNQDRQTLTTLPGPATRAQSAAYTGVGVIAGIFKIFGPIGGLVVILMIIGGITSLFRSCEGGQNAQKTTTYTTPPPIYTQPTPSYSKPSPGNNTYRERNNGDFELRLEKAAIESDRAQLQALSNEIDSDKAQLDYSERALNRYNQSEIDAFNAKVGIYNAQLEDYKIKQATFNARVDAYNTKARGNR